MSFIASFSLKRKFYFLVGLQLGFVPHTCTVMWKVFLEEECGGKKGPLGLFELNSRAVVNSLSSEKAVAVCT